MSPRVLLVGLLDNYSLELDLHGAVTDPLRVPSGHPASVSWPLWMEPEPPQVTSNPPPQPGEVWGYRLHALLALALCSGRDTVLHVTCGTWWNRYA